MWYSGDIGSAIVTTKRERRILFVFICKEDDEPSARLQGHIEDEIVASTCREGNMVCLRLVDGSQSARQFSQIYPVASVPCIFLIGLNGAPLQYIVDKADHTPQAINDLLATAIKLFVEQLEAAKAKSKADCEVRSTAAVDAQLAAATTSTPIDERKAHAQQLLADAREKKDKHAVEEEREREMERREAGRQMDASQSAREQREVDELVAERKSRRASDKAALDRVKQQIEADRKEKKQRFDQLREESLAVQAERRSVREAVARPPVSNEARIMFRFLDGKSAPATFEAKEKLSAAVAWVEEHHPCGTAFTLSQTYPRREFTDDDMQLSFRQLELNPSATLIVRPVGARLARPITYDYEETYHGMAAGMLWKVVLLPYVMLMAAYGWWYRPSIAATTTTTTDKKTDEPIGRPTNVSQNSRLLATQDDAPRPREGGVRRLRDVTGEGEEDDNATWNGNSTQQL